MAKMTTDQLIEAFKEMSLIELSDFVKKFEEVAAPVAVAAAGPAVAVEEVEEKDTFDVILESHGDNKISVIKEVRAITNLGLGEAKALVDSAPKPVLEGVKKEDAEKAKATLEAAGATVTLK
jgi:large subunit ribosomal protein L7/L12